LSYRGVRIAAFWPEIILRTRAARASRSGHEALAMDVLHRRQTGPWGMLRSRNWCSGTQYKHFFQHPQNPEITASKGSQRVLYMRVRARGLQNARRARCAHRLPQQADLTPRPAKRSRSGQIGGNHDGSGRTLLQRGTTAATLKSSGGGLTGCIRVRVCTLVFTSPR
jgi:hypothetical protein